MMNINDLPPELLVTVFSFSSQRDLLCQLSRVCKYWSELVLSVSLWYDLDLNRLVIENFMKKDDLIRRISQIFMHVHIMKASPGRLEILLRGSKEKFINLKRLELKPTCVSSGQIFQLIHTRCPNLKSLHVKFYSDTISLLNFVFGLQSVEDLHLYHETTTKTKNLSGNEMGHLAGLLEDINGPLQHINKIELQSYSSDLIQPLLELVFTKIICLNAFGPSVKNLTISSIKKATNLTELRLDFSAITNHCLADIAENNPNLRILSLQCCKQITDKGLVTITKSCQKIEQLFVRNSLCGLHIPHESKLTLQGISNRCSSLKVLSAQSLKGVDNTHLAELLGSCHCLTSLSLCDCEMLSDTSLKVIAQCCTLLELADFSQCPNITLDGILHLLDHCLYMKKLSLVSCSGLVTFAPPRTQPEGERADSSSKGPELKSEQSVETETPNSFGFVRSHDLPTRPTLQVVNFAYCEQLEPVSLSIISAKCQELRNIILRFCGEPMQTISSEILQQVFTSCYHLQSIPIGVMDVIEKCDVERYVGENGKYPCWQNGALI